MWQGIVGIFGIIIGALSTIISIIYTNYRLRKNNQYQQFKDLLSCYGTFKVHSTSRAIIAVNTALHAAQLGANKSLLTEMRNFNTVFNTYPLDYIAIEKHYEILVNTINAQLFRKLKVNNKSNANSQ